MKYKIYRLNASLGDARKPFSAICNSLSAARERVRQLKAEYGLTVGTIVEMVPCADGIFREGRYQVSF